MGVELPKDKEGPAMLFLPTLFADLMGSNYPLIDYNGKKTTFGKVKTELEDTDLINVRSDDKADRKYGKKLYTVLGNKYGIEL